MRTKNKLRLYSDFCTIILLCTCNSSMSDWSRFICNLLQLLGLPEVENKSKNVINFMPWRFEFLFNNFFLKYLKRNVKPLLYFKPVRLVFLRITKICNPKSQNFIHSPTLNLKNRIRQIDSQSTATRTLQHTLWIRTYKHTNSIYTQWKFKAKKLVGLCTK